MSLYDGSWVRIGNEAKCVECERVLEILSVCWSDNELDGLLCEPCANRLRGVFGAKVPDFQGKKDSK